MIRYIYDLPTLTFVRYLFDYVPRYYSRFYRFDLCGVVYVYLNSPIRSDYLRLPPLPTLTGDRWPPVYYHRTFPLPLSIRTLFTIWWLPVLVSCCVASLRSVITLYHHTPRSLHSLRSVAVITRALHSHSFTRSVTLRFIAVLRTVLLRYRFTRSTRVITHGFTRTFTVYVLVDLLRLFWLFARFYVTYVRLVTLHATLHTFVPLQLFVPGYAFVDWVYIRFTTFRRLRGFHRLRSRYTCVTFIYTRF